MAELLAERRVPLLIHRHVVLHVQPLDENDDLLDTLEHVGAGCIAFSPLAQGLLTDRYLDGIPPDRGRRRVARCDPDSITDERLAHVHALNEIAARRGQTLAELALAWALHDTGRPRS